jgi:mannosyltransferase
LGRWAPLLVALATAVLASTRLSAKSLWHDEAFTLAVASSEADAFWQAILQHESFAGLYYGIMRLWSPPWTTEAGLRAPSVLFAALAAATCYAIARDLFGHRVAALSAMLLAINVLFIRYAQEARAYSLALWLVSLATWALIRAVARPSLSRWLLYGSAAAVAVYAHFFAALVIAGHMISLVVHRTLVPWRRVAAAAALGATLVLPLAVVVLSTNAGGRPQPADISIVSVLRVLSGAGPTGYGIALVAIFAMSYVIGLGTYVRRRHDITESWSAWRYTLLACWLWVPIALAAIVSQALPVFVTRYFVLCLPALVILVAVGVTALRPAVQMALIIVVMVIGIRELGLYYQADHKEGENWRGLVEYVAAGSHSDDGIIFLSRYGRRPFEYYQARHPGLESKLVPLYPPMPWGSYLPVVGESQVGTTTTAARQARTRDPRRIWTVMLWGGFDTGHEDGAPLERLLTDEYTETVHRSFGPHLELARYERP